jgi:hypothetical protein
MARMHPESIDDYEGATDGEKRVFRFIREAARPHKDYVCWYEPSIGSSGKEPDFVLFGKNLGLLVLEVKDWANHQILSYDPHQFTVMTAGKAEDRTNPDKQAKGYVNALLERLKESPDFLSKRPGYWGSTKISIGRMVVFPNLSRHEYFDRALQHVIPTERVLIAEDLEPGGEILCDPSGRKFLSRVSGSMPFKFQGLTAKEAEKLNAILWPESRIELPPRQGAGKSTFQAEVRWLDEAQSRLALRLGSGHQIIKGPPGSGKTLVLAHRCCHLFRYAPKVKKILMVCYNIALVRYLKRLVQEKGIGIGGGGIHICHFYDLCGQIIGEPIHFEKEDSDYYDLVT